MELSMMVVGGMCMESDGKEKKIWVAYTSFSSHFIISKSYTSMYKVIEDNMHPAHIIQLNVTLISTPFPLPFPPTEESRHAVKTKNRV
jgi:hypothetical protein